MMRRSPPRLAQWLLGGLVAGRDREVLLGDLAEEFSLRVHSSGAGGFWYWGQVLRSVPVVVWSSVRQGRWILTLAVALGAYIAAGIVEFFATGTLSGFLSPDSPMHTAASLCIGLATILAGGYVAARIRPGADKAMGILVAFAVVALMAAQVGNVPLWYQVAFLVAGPFSSVAGGVIWARRKK